MSWGLQTRDSSGNVRLTQDKRLCRLIWSRVVAGGTSGSAFVPVGGFSNATAVCTPLEGDQFLRHVPHAITFNPSNGYLTWTSQTFGIDPALNANAQFVTSTSLIQVFAYG